jgi:hypothetical protein
MVVPALAPFGVREFIPALAPFGVREFIPALALPRSGFSFVEIHGRPHVLRLSKEMIDRG